MKLGIGLAAAAIALVIPLSASAAGAATTEYSPLCEMAYQIGQSAWDPMFQQGPGYANAVELALCGENRHG